jgi:hypothetical protein
MSDETPESLIPYDEIVQDALRAVVGRVLGEIERTGALPGGHHFYITFNTRMPGVSIPKHLSDKFPDEMTIVIQHRFWDLKVEEDAFSVGLSFGGVPATLHVPFAAVTQFHDPAVEFALTFQANAEEEPPEEHEAAENDAPAGEPAEDGSNVVSVDFTRKK